MRALVILWALFQAIAAPPASDPIGRIRAKTPVEDLSSLEPSQIAGVFKNPGQSLVRQIGGALSGDVLYLLPDETYIFTEWSDISPETISDKGVWTYSHSVVELVSDADVKWKPRIDRLLIVLRRSSMRDEVLLFEAHRLPDFENNADQKPESMLLIIAKERFKRLKASEIPKLKTRLIRTLWNPNVYRQ